MRARKPRILKNRLLMAILLLSQSAGVQAAEEFLEFGIQGQARRVLVYTPDVPSSGPPTLVVVFHGRGEKRQGTAMRGWQ